MSLRKNAIAWIGFLPLISKARDGHEQAATSERAASQGAGHGRGTSSNGHDAIEQAINLHVPKSVGEGKGPGPSKVESIRGNNKAS
jgi:hypothetical protein